MLFETHPVAIIIVVGIVCLVVAVAIGCALDVLLDSAERDEPPARPCNPAVLTDEERDALMAAHRRVVARHTADFRQTRARLREVSRR